LALTEWRSIDGFDSASPPPWSSLMQDHRIEGVGEVDAEDLLALLDAANVRCCARR
jgi:hypothetical protein